jgi:hypothetical protein
VLTGIDPLDYSGGAVSGAGDIDGDGVDDLAIGADHADGGGLQNAGEGYIVFGRDAGQGAALPRRAALASLLPDCGRRLAAAASCSRARARSTTQATRCGWPGTSTATESTTSPSARCRRAPADASRQGQTYVIFGRR